MSSTTPPRRLEKPQKVSTLNTIDTTPRPVAPTPATADAPVRPTPVVVGAARRIRVILRASDKFIATLVSRFGIQDRTDVAFAPATSRLEDAKAAGVQQTFDGRREHTGRLAAEKSSVTAGLCVASIGLTRRLVDISFRDVMKDGKKARTLTLDFESEGETVSNAAEIIAAFAGTFAQAVKVWINPTAGDDIGDVTVNFMQVMGEAKKANTRLMFTQKAALAVAEAEGPYDLHTGRTYVAPPKAPVAG